MPLAPGTKLGPYEVVGVVGAGGMGEVYRARDTRLDRTVAIKVLPEHLSQQPENRERFLREARSISVLSHPHICTLYDIGQQDGCDYLVMEFVDGETLSARLQRGAMPVEEVLRSGIEIADAMAKAHRQGIVHRDLKPGNIMLTKSGVKLLDFGLAKALPAAGNRDAALTAMATSSQPLTGQGRIVGTLHYMAPEQLEGKDADVRSDIFSFGAVLYEMASGRKAFEGKSAATVIAAILEREPPSLHELQPMTPPALERVVKICLAKDPDDRWQTAHDVGLELKWILDAGSQTGLPAPVLVHRKKRERAAWILAGLLALAMLVLLAAYIATLRMRPPVIVSSVLPPAGARFSFVGGHSGVPQISLDGRTLLLVVTDADGTNSIWLRPLDSASARPVPGTEGAESPFWSPDGKSIGFFAAGKLKTIPLSGGPLMSIADVSNVLGGTWNERGTILFAPAIDSGIYQVAAAGGSPQRVLSFDKAKFVAYAWPRFLPDGKHFIYSAAGVESNTGIYFASLDGRENQLVARGVGNADFSSGLLFYPLPGTTTSDLMALPLDPSTGHVKGEPQRIVQGIQYQEGPNQAAFAVSNRLLVYQGSPTGIANPHSLVWLDRSGKKLSVVAPGQDSFDLRLSPDGQRLAFSKGGPNSEIWIQDLKRDVPMRITFDASLDKGAPTWSPDGNQILFDIVPGGKTPPGIYRKSSSGTGVQQLLAQPNQSDATLWPTDWSRDGKFILGVQGQIFSRTRGEIWVLPTSGDGKPRIFIRAPSAAYDGQFSPDGHWVAYVSKESGREEVYVVPFDANEVLKTQPLQEIAIPRKWQVSAKGGSFPRWRRDSQELYYVGPGNEFIAANIQAKGNIFSVADTKPLFRESLADAAFPYDVNPDGHRFLVNSFGDTGALPLSLVVNWKESLKQ